MASKKKGRVRVLIKSAEKLPLSVRTHACACVVSKINSDGKSSSCYATHICDLVLFLPALRAIRLVRSSSSLVELKNTDLAN